MTKLGSGIYKYFKELDEATVFDQERDLRGRFTKMFLNIFTELGSSFVIFGIILLIAFFDDYQTIYIFLPIYLFQLISIETIKKIFGRNRPKTYTDKNFLGIASTSGSFPSGHSSNIFCLSYLICNFYQTNLLITTLIFVIAANVALSRILLGKHFAIDVIAGCLLGLFFAISGTLIWIYIYSNTELIRIIF